MDGLLSTLLAICLLLILVSMVKSYLEGDGPWTALLHIPLLVLIFYLSYTCWKSGRDIARLRSKLEKAKEHEKDLALQFELAKIEKEKKKLRSTLDGVQKANDRLDVEIRKLKSNYEVEKTAVGRITTWDDFWGHVRPKSPDEDPSNPSSNH